MLFIYIVPYKGTDNKWYIYKSILALQSLTTNNAPIRMRIGADAVAIRDPE